MDVHWNYLKSFKVLCRYIQSIVEVEDVWIENSMEVEVV